MSDNSSIEWTDATWNPLVGCERISPGCAHCYAKAQHDMRHTAVLAGKRLPVQYQQPFETLQLRPDRLEQPLHWRKPRRVFVNSLSDLFHQDVPDDFIDKVFAVMALAPRHTFQVLTKRPERMREYFTRQIDGWGRGARIADAAQIACGFDGSRYDVAKAARTSRRELALPDGNVFWIGPCNPPDQPYKERWILKTWPLRNVWLGVSVENQRFADERIPLLLQTPAAVRFISAEPLLGSLELMPFLTGHDESECPKSDPACCSGAGDCHDACESQPRLDWVIVGGESGPGARPFHIKWARSVVAQCKSARVPCFIKQLGAQPVNAILGPVNPVNLRAVGVIHDRKGGDPSEWPVDLRVRQFPRPHA